MNLYKIILVFYDNKMEYPCMVGGNVGITRIQCKYLLLNTGMPEAA